MRLFVSLLAAFSLFAAPLWAGDSTSSTAPPNATFVTTAPDAVPTAEPPAPTRTFGGCNAKGTFCAGPSVLVSITAYNLTQHKVEAGFNPGIGYGVTFYPDKWYAFGAAANVQMQTGPVSSIQTALMAKFANYVRIGIAHQNFGGEKAWLVPIGFGTDVNL